MQAPPAQAPEPAHHAICRGCGERRKPEPSNRADDQIDAMCDLVKELAEAVALIRKKQREMRGNVTERSDAENPAHIYQITVAKDPAERRHCERQPEEDQCPEASAMNKLIERSRAVRDLTRFE